jgi:polar amino acid transport system substrate-binding protein
VKWIVTPFNLSFKPGTKKFDFDINQISVTDERDRAVDFSDSYYDVNQALVAVNGTPLATASSMADLKSARLGAQIGTTSLGYIQDTIQPEQDPRVYDTSNDVVAALNAKQIDGIVVDLPTAFFLVGAEEVKNGKVVGQFEDRHRRRAGALRDALRGGNTLRDCVNDALAELKSAGTLDQIQQEWLSEKASAPVLK